MGYIEDMQRTLRHSAPPKSKHVEALWRGTVTDVRSDGLLRVRIPALGGTASLGPMPSAAPGAAVGDQVIVGAIAGQYAEMMVIQFAGVRNVPGSGTTGRAILAAETIPQAKTAAGIPNVENTADLDKPVSNATALAISQGLGTKANTSHTHLWAHITDKPATFAPTIGTTAVTAKAGNWVPSWTEVTSKPATFAPIVGTGAADAKAGNWVPSWTEVTAKPTTFAPIVGIGAADAKAGNWVPAWTDVTGKPATFAPSAHTHLWAELTDKPATFTPSAHSHAAADTTTGVFAPALLPAATQAAQGAMSAADKTKLDAATAAATNGALVMRSVSGSIAVNTGTGTTDAANKAYVDTYRHRRAEYYVTSFGVTPNTSWDAGPFVLDTAVPGRTVGTSFSTSTGAVSGAVFINETGFYSLSAILAPDANPGAAYVRIALYNANGTLSEVLTQEPNGGSMSWESVGHVPVPVYITTGQYVRVVYVASLGHNIASRLKIWKLGTLGTWGM